MKQRVPTNAAEAPLNSRGSHRPRTSRSRHTPCVEIKIIRRVRAESSRRPPRHRCDACSMAWRCRFLAARRDQRGRVIAIPDTLVDFHTDRHRRCFLRQLRRHRRRASSLPSSSLGRLRPCSSSWPWSLSAAKLAARCYLLGCLRRAGLVVPEAGVAERVALRAFVCWRAAYF